jgi:superfamily II DNA or RNA helicase
MQYNKYARGGHMSIKLDPHQEKAVEFVLKHKKAALFMGVGTGKTYTSLEIFRRVKPKKCLIITTARLIREEQWFEEIHEYLGYFPKEIELISHNMLSRRYKEYIKKRYDMIIFDEAHKVKAHAKNSGGTKISRLMLILSKKAEYVIPMTGTPISNDFVDVFNIFRNCDINMWHGWTLDEFIQAYYYYYYKDWSGAGFEVIIPIALKPHLEEALWNLVRKKAIVIKTSEVLDLKKQKFKLFYIDGMSDTKIYKDLVKDKIIRYKDFEDTLIALKRINFQRQAANGFIYEETYDREPYQFNDNKINAFGNKVESILEKTKKMVVVYWFKHDKTNIINKLEELGISHTTSKKDFEKNKQVFILHFSDSEGLNLQDICNTMLFYSYQSSYMHFSQICGRIFRRGQKKECVYIMMISRNTIEERIWSNIKNKKSYDDFIKNEFNQLGG